MPLPKDIHLGTVLPAHSGTTPGETKYVMPGIAFISLYWDSPLNQTLPRQRPGGDKENPGGGEASDEGRGAEVRVLRSDKILRLGRRRRQGVSSNGLAGGLFEKALRNSPDEHGSVSSAVSLHAFRSSLRSRSPVTV